MGVPCWVGLCGWRDDRGERECERRHYGWSGGARGGVFICARSGGAAVLQRQLPSRGGAFCMPDCRLLRIPAAIGGREQQTQKAVCASVRLVIGSGCKVGRLFLPVRAKPAADCFEFAREGAAAVTAAEVLGEARVSARC